MQLILETQFTEDTKANMSMQAESPVSKDITDLKKGIYIANKENHNKEDETISLLEKSVSNKTETGLIPVIPSEIANETLSREEQCQVTKDTLQETELFDKVNSAASEKITNGTYNTQDQNESKPENDLLKVTIEEKLCLKEDEHVEFNLSSNVNEKADCLNKNDHSISEKEHVSNLELSVADDTKIDVADNSITKANPEISKGDTDVKLQISKTITEIKDNIEVLNTSNMAGARCYSPDANNEPDETLSNENINNTNKGTVNDATICRNINPELDISKNEKANTEDCVSTENTLVNVVKKNEINIEEDDVLMESDINKALKDVALNKETQNVRCENVNLETTVKQPVDVEMIEIADKVSEVPVGNGIATDNKSNTVITEKVPKLNNSTSMNDESNPNDVAMLEIEVTCTSVKKNSFVENSEKFKIISMTKDVPPPPHPCLALPIATDSPVHDKCFSAPEEKATEELNIVVNEESNEIVMIDCPATTDNDSTDTNKLKPADSNILLKDTSSFLKNVESSVIDSKNFKEKNMVVHNDEKLDLMETDAAEIIQEVNVNKTEPTPNKVISHETNLDVTESTLTSEAIISKGTTALLNKDTIETQLKEIETDMELDDVEIVDSNKDDQDENTEKTVNSGASTGIQCVKIAGLQQTSQKLPNKENSINVRTDLMINNDVKNSTENAIESLAENSKDLLKTKATQEDQDKVEILDEDDIKFIETDKPDETLNKNKEKAPKKNVTKTLPVVCKLSNTLDILSDDEEQSQKGENIEKNNSDTEKQCINIDDDDDIMLIEEDSNSKESTNEDKTEVSNDKEESQMHQNDKIDLETGEKNVTNTEIEEPAPIPNDSSPVNPPSMDFEFVPQTVNISDEQSKKPETTTPLLPQTFLKTAKKNLADMTRHELEDFCILRIVESIVDRSNLSDIKTKMKTMAQSLEDFKKRALMLTKQNRDLQVVLKSVQEEQKKRTNTPIQPLKITRSVGMQVLMNDKLDPRRKGLIPNQISTIPAGRPARAVQAAKTIKPPGNPPAIPVPRKVPVNNSAVKTVTTTTTVSNTGNKATSPNPNGLRNPSPVQKAPEKRTHSRMQASSSVTVDLTDDEPPPKINNKTAPVPPVRVVPPQNLLTQPRPFAPPLNSPRKVYIPISGPQNQSIRPGQTLMMRSVPPLGPRQRLPSVPRMQQSPIRVNKAVTNRHPAPLPDAMKQYTPPAWKALPPAPDLKLSKVENGIVISWKIDALETGYETIASYQLYAYQETTAPPSTALWKKIGDVKALPLPMACTLTQFMAGFKYYFAVRAVDIRSRLGPFSLPGSILLLNKV